MNKYTIKCPNCSKQHSFPEEYLGKQAKCHCGTKFPLVLEKSQENTPHAEQESISSQKLEDALSGNPQKRTIPEQILKPDMLSFLFLPLLVLGIMTFVTFFFDPIFGLGVFFVAAIVAYFYYIAYQKERYELKGRKIIRHYGTVFSDNSVEVQLDRVVIVKCKRPWILHMLFQTGYITLKAAGSSQSKFHLVHMKDPLQLYETLQQSLRDNGFHLKKDRLVQTAKPHILGIFGEVGKQLFGSIFVLFYIYFGITSEGEDGSEGMVMSDFGIFPYIFMGFIGAVIIGYLVLGFLDLRRRKYDIYDDAVEYTEGFLTKYNSIIPMENVSDVENTQSFFSKIFGLHDIKVSCQGSGNDVMFKNMTHGEKMIENLKYLKNAIIPKEKTKVQSAPDSQSLVGYTDKIEQPLAYNQEFTASYSMHKLKTIAPYLVFLIPPLTPFGIVMIIGVTIKAMFTTFSVTSSSIEKKFHFLSNKHTSYSIEKITGITIQESLLDKFFKTCSVSFMSIGSSGDITFSNIKKTPELERNLMEKIGIYETGDIKNIPIHFTFGEYIKANIGQTIAFCLILSLMFIVPILSMAVVGDFSQEISDTTTFLSGFAIILTVILIIGFLPVFFYKKLFYSPRFYKNYLFDQGVAAHSGIIFQKKEYALHRNVKGITSVKYPLTQTGKLVFNVSGEKFVQQGKKNSLVGSKTQGIMVSNTIKIAYTQDVQNLHLELDTLLAGQQLSTESLLSTQQDLGNTLLLPLVGALIITGIAFVISPLVGIIVLIPCVLVLGLITWYIKVKYYNLESSRVFAASGIIYKTQKTILYSKFNFIELNRGFFNKVFKNGSISIYTLGSGKKEMSITDVDAYEKIYDMLQTK